MYLHQGTYPATQFAKPRPQTQPTPPAGRFKSSGRGENFIPMERGSAKHNPKVDEELKRQTRSLEQGAPVESHVEEYRQQEAAGDDEPIPDARITSADGHLDELEARADFARVLGGVRYPARRAQLEEATGHANAPAPILKAIASLDGERSFENFEEVWRAARAALKP